MLELQKSVSASKGKSPKGLGRFAQEEIGKPLADKIYKEVFGDVEITREHGSLLDREHAIDVNIKFNNGMILTCQEKFLSYEYANRATVTVEYWQNPSIHERGDWFKLASQLYFVGYLTKEYKAFSPWVLLNWPLVVLETQKNTIKWTEQKNKKTSARASFVWTPMNKIPNSCIIMKG